MEDYLDYSPEEFKRRLEEMLSKSKPSSAPAPQEQKPLDNFDEIQSILSTGQRMFTELKTQLGEDYSGQNLILCAPQNSKDLLVALCRLAIDSGKKPVLVLTALNYRSVQRVLLDAKIDPRETMMIDPLAKNILNEREKENILFVDSLMNLTQIQIKLINAIDAGEKVVFVFDSLEIFELYHEPKVLFKFISSVTKLLHVHDVDAFYILGKKPLVSQLSQFFDNFVEIKKI